MKALRLALVALALQSSLALAQTPLVAGIDRSGFDAGVRPQDDLFKAVNGQWLKDTPIPADKGDYGLAIQLRDQSDARVRAIVEALAQQTHPTGSVEQKIGDYYRSYMDEAAIDRAGLRPLAPWLAQIDGVRTKSALAALFGRWQGVAATPIQAWVQSDFKQPGINRALTWQGDLGLPDRDYYLLDDTRFGEAREAYRSYLQTLFRLSGDAHAAASIAAVFALEKRLAQTQWTRVDNRDAQKIYNPMTLAALTQAAPGFDWPAFFRAAALPAIDRLSVSQPSYAAALAKAVADTPLASWKLYLRARLLDAAAPMLPQAFRDAHFAFHGRALLGLQAPKPRWQDAIHELNGALGEAVGQVYVARHFPAAHKARMQQLVNELLAAYAQSIGELAWMGPATKLQAQHKLAKIVTKIGYPDRWRDYARLQVRPGDALGNAARAGRFDYERVVRREGQPVDRREWEITPQTVNAYYNASLNEIVFPAAILEPPLFDMRADDAANYGAIGAIIGHEISHGFDDHGSQFDGDGKLANWWTDADRAAFTALGDRLAAQYAEYEPIPGHKVNGRLTLGENIADLSGLQIAYKAYQRSLAGKPAPVIDGLTGDERFFFGWAQAWRSKMRDERTLQLLTTNPHSPPAYRANGAAINHDAFHQTFGTRPGDAMYKPAEERIRIW